MLTQSTLHSSDSSSFANVEHDLNDTDSTMNTERNDNTAAAVRSRHAVTRGSCSYDEDASDSGHWGMVSNDGDLRQDEGRELQRQADVQILYTASFLTETSDSILNKGELIVEGRDTDTDNAPSDVSIDLSLPDPDSIPTDLPTLSIDRPEDGTNNDDDDDDGEANDAPGTAVQRLRQKHRRRKQRQDDHSSLATTEHFHKTQKLWIVLVGLLSTILLALVAVNGYLSHLRHTDRERFQQEIDRLLHIKDDMLHRSKKEHKELSAVLVKTVAGFARHSKQWDNDRTEYQEQITAMRLLQDSLQVEIKEQERLRLEEERKRKELEEQAKWDAMFGVDVASRGLTLVDNCWLKAQVDVHLESCAEEALQKFHKRVTAIPNTLMSILKAPHKAISADRASDQNLPAIAATASTGDCGCDAEQPADECECSGLSVPSSPSNGSHNSSQSSPSAAQTYPLADMARALTKTNGTAPALIPAGSNGDKDTTSRRWSLQATGESTTAAAAAAEQGRTSSEDSGTSSKEQQRLSRANQEQQQDAAVDDDADGRDSNGEEEQPKHPQLYSLYDRTLGSVKDVTERSLEKISDSTRNALKDASETLEASRKSIEGVSEVVHTATAATSDFQDAFRQASEAVSDHLRSFMKYPSSFFSSDAETKS